MLMRIYGAAFGYELFDASLDFQSFKRVQTKLCFLGLVLMDELYRLVLLEEQECRVHTWPASRNYLQCSFCRRWKRRRLFKMTAPRSQCDILQVGAHDHVNCTNGGLMIDKLLCSKA